jgi:hypothetical protein
LQTASLGAVSSLALGTAAASSIEDQYQSVVDVQDAGADASGSESITPVLREVIDDDTLLRFPPGRYYMDEQVRASGIDNVGLVGDDATLVPGDYYEFEGPTYRLFRLGTHYDPGRNIRVENFDIDQRAVDTGIRAFHVSATDGLLVRNVDIVGRHDSGTWGPVLVRITDPDGSGHVEGVRMPDGADFETETPGGLWRGPTGLLVNGHRGHLTFRDCVISNFPDNGLYVTGDGSVSVVGGRFRNSGPVNVRFGGREARVEGATFRVDKRAPNYAAQRPMRFDYADSVTVRDVDVALETPNGDALQLLDGVDRASVRESTIEIGDVPASGIVAKAGCGSLAVVDVDIEMECSANAIRLLGDGGGAVVQGGRIGGGGSGEVLRHAIRCERDNSEFRELTVDQWGGKQRRGIALLGDDYTVYNCRIRSSDRPISAHGSNVWIEGNYLDSYAGTESIRIGPTAETVRIKNNELPDGIEDAGGSNVTITGTTY